MDNFDFKGVNAVTLLSMMSSVSKLYKGFSSMEEYKDVLTQCYVKLGGTEELVEENYEWFYGNFMCPYFIPNEVVGLMDDYVSDIVKNLNTIK